MGRKLCVQYMGNVTPIQPDSLLILTEKDTLGFGAKQTTYKRSGAALNTVGCFDSRNFMGERNSGVGTILNI